MPCLRRDCGSRSGWWNAVDIYGSGYFVGVSGRSEQCPLSEIERLTNRSMESSVLTDHDDRDHPNSMADGVSVILGDVSTITVGALKPLVIESMNETIDAACPAEHQSDHGGACSVEKAPKR